MDLGGLIITPLSGGNLVGTEEMIIDADMSPDRPTTSSTLLRS